MTRGMAGICAVVSFCRMIVGMSHSTPSRPGLAFRVGVTGARKPPEAIEALRVRVTEVLEQVAQEMNHLADRADVRKAYRHEHAGGKPEPVLTLLSPLAEGADRLVADVALQQGYRLHVPMPFRQNDYEDDFKDSVPAFRALLDRADAGVLELDGGRDEHGKRRWHQSRSYEAVGRHVVHNCDLLIAIWDGAPPRGRGGTANIVRHALDKGVPVWWIDALDPDAKPIWLQDVAEPHLGMKGRSACAELTDYMHWLIVPPETPHPHAHGWIERLVRLMPGEDRAPHLTYLDGSALTKPWWTRAHAKLLKRTSRYTPESAQQQPPTLPIAQYWHAFYRQAGDISGPLGDRYRATYVWVFGLISLSLVLAAFGAAFVPIACLRVAAHLAALPEAFVIVVIFLLIACNIRYDWHQRWVDTRLLTELFRKQQAMAAIGWSLPGRAVSHLVDQQAGVGGRDRAAWVPWLFTAVMRAAPLPTGRLSVDLLRESLRMAKEDLVGVQLTYHQGRHEQYRRAARHLAIGGEVLFLAVAVLVALKVSHALAHPSAEPGAGSAIVEFLAIALPTLGAASVGIRAYAELQLLGEQSRHMAQIMRQAQASLCRLERRLTPDSGTVDPLVSQDLGLILHAVTTNMLEDVDGWARMFRVKIIEAG